MLKPLGIEKGKPFNPTPRQKKLLEEAALVDEAMAKANTFEKRFEDVLYRPETHWKYIVVCGETEGQVFILDIYRPTSYKDPTHFQQMGKASL